MHKKVSSNFESYSAHVNTTTQPKHLLTKIIQNNDYQEGTLNLLFSLVLQHPSISNDVIQYLRSLTIEDYECRHWLIKICFLVLEKTRETTPVDIILNSNFDTTVFLLDLIKNENKLPVVKNIVQQIDCERFLAALIKQLATSENVSWLKNAIGLFVELEYDFDNLDFLIESEHYFMRNGYLEYISRKIKKGQYEYLNVFYERLNDVSYNVRSRVLQLLGNLYNEGFLNPKIVEILEHVMLKIHDKTVIVRKKAICFCSNYLIVNDKDVNKEIDSLYQILLGKSLALLTSDHSNETCEILHLFKLSYFYAVTDSKQYFEKCFNLVWDLKSKIVLLECIKEITQKIDPVTFFYTFASSSDSFGKVIQSIKFKKIWTERIIFDLVTNKNMYESSIILANIRFVDVNYDCLYSTTKTLFNSSNVEELEKNCIFYNNVLIYVLNNKVRKCKCNMEDCESCMSYEKIITQIYRNVSKMNFCNLNIIDTTIKILFKSTNLERNILTLLQELKNKKFGVHIIYSLGVIVDEISTFLDKSESRIKKLNFKTDSIILENKEKRASITRLSIQKNLDNTFIQHSFIDNTVLNDTMINNTMLKELNEKSVDDEIGEYIFHTRETVMFKVKSSIFHEFLPEIMSLLNDETIGHIVHQTVFKFMRCSSELFLEHIHLLENGLKHVNDKIKNVSLFAMSSFLITYSAWVDSYIPSLFAALKDTNIILKEHSLLLIYNLYTGNLLKIKGYGLSIAAVYYDEDLRGIVLSFYKALTENDLANVINECGDENKECVEYLMKLIVNDKVKDCITNKIKNRNVEVLVK